MKKIGCFSILVVDQHGFICRNIILQIHFQLFIKILKLIIGNFCCKSKIFLKKNCLGQRLPNCTYICKRPIIIDEDPLVQHSACKNYIITIVIS